MDPARTTSNNIPMHAGRKLCLDENEVIIFIMTYLSDSPSNDDCDANDTRVRIVVNGVSRMKNQNRTKEIKKNLREGWWSNPPCAQLPTSWNGRDKLNVSGVKGRRRPSLSLFLVRCCAVYISLVGGGENGREGTGQRELLSRGRIFQSIFHEEIKDFGQLQHARTPKYAGCHKLAHSKIRGFISQTRGNVQRSTLPASCGREQKHFLVPPAGQAPRDEHL